MSVIHTYRSFLMKSLLRNKKFRSPTQNQPRSFVTAGHFPVLNKFVVELETFFTQFSVAEPLNSTFSFKKFMYAYVWLRSFIATIRQEAIDCVIRGLRMEETVASPKKTINGCCAFSDECKCRMFRCPVASKPYTCFCTHDISQHEMISVTDGVVTRFLSDAKSLPLPATPVATKDTIELQRRGIFLPYAHSGPSIINHSGGSKRPLARAADRPPRSSVGRAPADSNLVNIICLRREDKIPTNDLERLEMGANYLPAVPLSTHAKLLKVLKLASTLGEDLATKLLWISPQSYSPEFCYCGSLTFDNIPI